MESRNLFNLYGLELQAQGGEHEDCGHEHCQPAAEPTGSAAGFGDFSMEQQREPSPPARGSAAQCADMLSMHQRVTTSIRDSVHVGPGRLGGHLGGAAGPARSNSVQLPAIGAARSSSGPEPAAAAAEAAAASLARSDSCSSVATLPPSLGGGGHGGHGGHSH